MGTFKTCPVYAISIFPFNKGGIKKGILLLKEGQYLFAFLFFIVCVTQFQAALQAVPLIVSFLVLFPVLLVHCQVPVRIRDWIAALVAFYLA
jgi:hypothetical protein